LHQEAQTVERLGLKVIENMARTLTMSECKST